MGSQLIIKYLITLALQRLKLRHFTTAVPVFLSLIEVLLLTGYWVIVLRHRYLTA